MVSFRGQKKLGPRPTLFICGFLPPPRVTTIQLCTSLLALLAQLDRALPPFIAKVGIDSQVHLNLLVCSFTARTTSTFQYLLSQFTSSSSYALLTYKIIIINCRMKHIFMTAFDVTNIWAFLCCSL